MNLSVSPRELFDIIDAVDTERYRALCTDNPTFRFANSPPVVGGEAVQQAQRSFRAQITDMRHELARTWTGEGSLVVEGMVTFTRLDDSTITLPFVDVFNLEAGRIQDTLIYMDINPLFET